MSRWDCKINRATINDPNFLKNSKIYSQIEKLILFRFYVSKGAWVSREMAETPEAGYQYFASNLRQP
ncbi:hypothetical protein PPNK14_34180 [Pectobacterium parmentieri]